MPDRPETPDTAAMAAMTRRLAREQPPIAEALSIASKPGAGGARTASPDWDPHGDGHPETWVRSRSFEK